MKFFSRGRNALAEIARICAAGFLCFAVFTSSAQIVNTTAQITNTSNPILRSDDSYCTVTGEALKFMAPSTRKMAGLLERIAQTPDPTANTFVNPKRADLYPKQPQLTT